MYNKKLVKTFFCKNLENSFLIPCIFSRNSIPLQSQLQVDKNFRFWRLAVAGVSKVCNIEGFGFSAKG